MPTLIAAKEVKLEFADLERRVALIGRPAIPPARRPGIHQSGVLQYIAQQIGILKPGERDEEDFGTYPLLWALGQMWEEYIFSFYPNIDWQPGEITVDDVHMNCDGLGLDGEPFCLDDELMLEEGKATYKGVATGEEFIKDNKWWLWRMQAACYCWGYSTRLVRWHALHLRGNYQDFGPVYMQYVVRYSDKECRQVWNMVQNNKHKAVAETGEREVSA